MATGLGGGALTPSMVFEHAEASQRDVTVEIFPGLDRLYRERNSEAASTLIRTIDKDAGDFLNWVHWNNASLFTHNPSIRRGSSSLVQADRAMMGRFLNTAHRSTYWTQHLTALAASTANAVPLEGRIFPSYPHYLRRTAPLGRGSIVEKLAELAGTNKATTRDEFLHPLIVLSHDDSPLGDSSRFDVSLNLGLSGRSTFPLLAWPKLDAQPKRCSRSTRLPKRNTRTLSFCKKERSRRPRSSSSPPTVEATVHSNESEEEDEGPSPGQMTLF